MMRKILLVALTLSLLSGCGTTKLRNKQLEKVAKDWSLVIRASQVIPVYPLTEDLQPGDVLLVSTPIDQQAEIYERSGFLPLDQLLVRLMASNYKERYGEHFKEFYDSRYETDGTEVPPQTWQKPKGGQKHNWEAAPGAAFPTYQFSVKTGAGMNLAIPLQGVPFALGLMNSGSASGTVTIADAHTYGLDNYRLQRLVRSWANENRHLLSNYDPRDGEYRFLRVVSRVYVTGRVNVSVKNDQATGAGAAAGVDRPVDLLNTQEGDASQNYVAMLSRINTTATAELGGRVKVATASSRSVTMSETFDRPLVIGYVGFDMPIFPGGRLGAPISTLEQLRSPATVTAATFEGIYQLAALSLISAGLDLYEGEEADGVRAGLDALVDVLPEKYSFTAYEFSSVGRISVVAVADTLVDTTDFDSIPEYLGTARTTIETLQEYLPTAPRDTSLQQQEVELLEQDLLAAKAAVREIEDKLYGEPVLMRAIDFVFLGTRE